MGQALAVPMRDDAAMARVLGHVARPTVERVSAAVHLRYLRLGEGDIAALADALAVGTPALRSVSLAHRAVGPRGAASLGMLARRHARLEEMDLTRCALRPQGVEAFASAVGSESGGGGGGLVCLVLTGNDIDGPGALCLAGVAGPLPRLEIVVLAHNAVPRPAARALARALTVPGGHPVKVQVDG